MTKFNTLILSAVLNLTLSLAMVSYLLLSDVPAQTNALQRAFEKSTYPQSRDALDRDMAEIILPYLKNQKSAEESRGHVKKPNEVYTPEQLQQSRGYK